MSTTRAPYRRVRTTGEKIDRRRAIIGYEEAAKHAGVSKPTLMKAALEGRITPLGTVKVERGRPPLAFKRSDLNRYRKEMGR